MQTAEDSFLISLQQENLMHQLFSNIPFPNGVILYFRK